MKREVFYPPIGIAHVTNKLSDLILYKYKIKKDNNKHIGTT